MPFSESLAREVRHRCHYQCCLCKAIGVEIHHIVPQAEGGPDIIENAAPLCPSCHETYGANPVKRKFIREARDFWFDLCAKRYASDPSVLTALQASLESVATELASLKATFALPSNAVKIPLVTPTKGDKQRLGIRDLLVMVHASAEPRPSFQVELLCMRELWPVGKDDYRGVYNDFIRRFGNSTMRHLAQRALYLSKVPPAEHIAEDDLAEALSRMRTEAVCLNLLDEGALGAVLGDDGDVLWTGVAQKP